MSLLDRAIARMLPAIPRRVVGRLSSPYIAGPSLEDAVRVVRRLNEAGKQATVDVLGEEIRSPAEAAEIVRQYRLALERIEVERLDANISVKLTGLGLELDRDLCRRNLEVLVEDARDRGNFVRIDMEDSSTTDAALELYRELRAAGHENLGVVLQAYLRRTLGDVPGLDNVRVCKGIYVEPAAIAFQDADEIRASYVSILDRLIEQGAAIGVATHDELLLRTALERLATGELGSRVEFQMLLGVRSARGDELVRAGHRLRVYVPYGTHWYEYSVRRLQENPRIAGYVAADLARSAVGRVRRR